MAFDHACLTNQSFNETLDSILKVWKIASPKYSAILIDLDRVTSAEDVDRLKNVDEEEEEEEEKIGCRV